MNKRRVVVTGLGLVSPVGMSVSESWNTILSCGSGVDKIKAFDSDSCHRRASKVAGEVTQFIDLSGVIDLKEERKMCRFIKLSIKATDEALKDASWLPNDKLSRDRTSVIIGSGIGGIGNIAQKARRMSDDNYSSDMNATGPFFIPATIPNMAAGNISIKYGFTGSSFAIASACSTGNHCIGEAFKSIQDGRSDVTVSGGAESTINRISLAGFSAMQAMSTKFNDDPKKASRPWDRDRDGFVMGEGAGILILEEYEHAKSRGVKIYAEVLGYGATSDAYHMSAPKADGEGAARAMRIAIQDAGIMARDIDYINAHGTSTQAGDLAEALAIRDVFGDHIKSVSISSTKSATGHLLGAAGAIEGVFSVLSIRDQVVPPTLNLENPSPEFSDLDLVPLKPKYRNVKYSLSNSFGFGGTNAVLVFGRYDQ